MAYHATCNSEITVYFPYSGWDGRLFWQLDGLLTPECEVTWVFEVSNGMESYFDNGNCGFPDAFLVWLLTASGGLVYPTASCDVTVTATVTCDDEEIGEFVAVVHLVYAPI